MANNRASCGSYLSDEELVIIRLGLPSTASTPTTNNNIGYTSEETNLVSNFIAERSSVEAEAKNTSIQRITMKTKNKRPPSSKILEAGTDFSKAPLIVAPNTNITNNSTANGLATNYYLENEDTMEGSDLEELEINLSPSTKVCLSRNNSKNLSKKDLPRRVRSPRQLSHCNEQIFKFSQSELKLPVKSQQQKVHQPHQQLTLIKRDSQRSLIMESPQASSNNNSNNKNNNNNAKAVSCEAISVPHQIESKPTSKTQKSAKSLSALTEKEPVQNQPIWGQFHFIPNGSISIGTNYLVQTPYNTSYTTLGTVSALYNSGALDPPQAPVVLMPSSYDLSPKENDNDDRCFTLILISGSLVLLATVSASVGFILGIF